MASGNSARGSSFYWGIRMLPADKREAVAAVYAFCRAADDAADIDPSRGAEAVARWREELESCYAGFPKHPVMKALHPVIRTYKLNRGYFDMILAGMEMDLAKRRYANLDELYGYCDCVAGAVGLLVLQVLGLASDPRATAYSQRLSYGLQLTNILRDMRADVQIGRVYLPQDAMAAYGYSEEELRKGAPTIGFFKLARFLANKAEENFAAAKEALDTPLRRAMVGPEIMRATYEALLHRIMKAADLALDGNPPRLSRTEKFVIALATWVHVKYL